MIFDQPLAWTGSIVRHEGKRVTVTVRRQEQRRSIKANSRYWAVLVPLAGHLLSKTRDLPLSKKQVHYVLASAFAGTEESPLGVPIPVETHTFTTEQFHTYCTAIEVWLAEAGYTVPAPGELLEASL